MNPKIMIGLNTTWNLVNFRAGLILALRQRGYEVVALAPPDRYVPRLEALGCRHLSLAMDAQGTNPGRDVGIWWQFLRAMRRERPDVYLGYTVKPNLYGSLAAHCLGIPVVNNITGLGAAFIRPGWITRLVRAMYRIALSRSQKVFFQNEEDRTLFLASGLVSDWQADRLPGSGVDLSRFRALPMPDAPERPFRFLMVARLLKDKGIVEYVEAARMLKREHPHVEFAIMGALDAKNPDSVRSDQLAAWIAEGAIKYIAASDRVAAEMAEANCVVLPSYREGMPRTLLEAAATARPIIATDVEGCREIAREGVNGFVCRPRDTVDLARAMDRMLRLSPEARAQMGRRARMRVEREFDERIVIGKYLDAIDEIIAAGAQPDAGDALTERFG